MGCEWAHLTCIKVSVFLTKLRVAKDQILLTQINSTAFYDTMRVVPTTGKLGIWKAC